MRSERRAPRSRQSWEFTSTACACRRPVAFDTHPWQSTGIDYSVDLRSAAPDEAVARLLEVVDSVAEIPRAIRIGAPVRRIT